MSGGRFRFGIPEDLLDDSLLDDSPSSSTSANHRGRRKDSGLGRFARVETDTGSDRKWKGLIQKIRANQSAASAQQPSADPGSVRPSPPAASHPREPDHHAPVAAVAEREAAQPEAEEKQQHGGDGEAGSDTVNDDEATMQQRQKVEEAGEPAIAQAASIPAVAPLSQTTGRETTGVTAGASEAPAYGAQLGDCPPTLPDMTQPAPIIAPRVLRPPAAAAPRPAPLSSFYRLCDGPGLKRKRKRAGQAEQQEEHPDGEDVDAGGALHLLGRGEREREGPGEGEGGEAHDDGGGGHGAGASLGGGCTATVLDTDTFVPQPRQPRIIEDQQSDHHHHQQQHEELANGEAAVADGEGVGGAEGAEPSTVVGVLEHTASADASVPVPRVVELREGTFVIGRQRDKVDLHLDSTKVPNMISRMHATILVDRRPGGSQGGQGQYVVRVMDTRSTNGLFVNSVKCTDAILNDGDVITLGGGHHLAVGDSLEQPESEFVFTFRRHNAA